ncbi:hypothetical protein DF156_11030 [Burkholderia ubonensis]|uniref:Uncharacterized protein n=1 Tax=Burkholderia ubonensis TaxID=101571 RepID=A0AB74DE51_9BURK|nr:hypothetical protein CJO71_02100 [Burkholderia ubonensis]PAJ84831.1 hypothetical protein CJO70_27115 [Burkholderia ubonensis]PAJ93956.1 hypothetical protein CJO69_12070 [Burkholderia ubonensis]PAJ96903.1 hypothetical protein CJO68_31770 [Burkholderia ubonensis]PAK09747.1 hypothetical protein CJO67_01380 [Burkholderia ubonensis]
MFEAVKTQRVQGEYGYDTANVDRNHFGATLVEERFRPCGLSEVSNAAPRKRGRIFFVAKISRVTFIACLVCRPLTASRRLLWFRYACLTAQFDNTSIR